MIRAVKEKPMKFNSIKLATVFGSLMVAGCVTHTETVYRDVPRVKVEFETERAGRIFYEAFSKLPKHNNRESHTELSIPVIFEHKSDVRSSDSEAFNDAVQRCDTNQDGKISETEAEIFAAQKR